VSLKSIHWGEAFRLVWRTLPIAGARLGVLVLFWLGTLIYFAAVGALAYFAAQAAPWLGIVLGVIGLGGYGWLYSLAQRYVLYLVKAAQIAVMARLLETGELPGGIGQLQWGKEQVTARFGEVSAMFLVDQVVTAVVRGFSALVSGLASWAPGDALKGLARMAGRVAHYAVTYVDEAILARTFWVDDGTVWANARDGVVLYAMVWKALLLNAVVLMLASYVPAVLVVLLLAAPAGLLASAVAQSLEGWIVLAIVALGLVVKAAIGDSFAMAAIIAAYRREIEGLEPDPALLARLGKVPRFGYLAQRVEEEEQASTGMWLGPEGAA